MERRSVSEIIDQYEPLLRKYEKDEQLVILEAEEDYGTKAGENYMSIVLRTKIKGKLGNGNPYEKSFMRKIRMQNTEFAKMTNNDKIFEVESYVYKKVLPRLGPFGPDCILAEPCEIIMEDLGSRSFSICDRRKLLDYDHCLAVIETLSSMHASSMRIKLQDHEGFLELVTPLRENMFPSDNEDLSIMMFLESAITYAVLSLDSIKVQQPEATHIINYLNNYQDKLLQKMTQLLSPRSAEDLHYWVITHGDTWNNNVMFLHDSDGKIVQVKLVDFQVCRHFSPALDFAYFLYASARSDVLNHDIDKLINAYENSFLDNLRRMNVPDKDLDAFKKKGWLKEQIRNYGPLGFFQSLMVLHAIFMNEDLAKEFETTKTTSDFDFESHKAEKMPLSPEKTERIFFITNHFIKNFVS